MLAIFTISILSDNAWNPIIVLATCLLKRTPTPCLCSVLCPEYIITCSSVIHFPEFFHLTSDTPRTSNVKRLAYLVMHSSFPGWFIVRTFHVAILAFFRRLHAVTGWRSKVLCCCDTLPPSTTLLELEFAVLFTPGFLFCFVIHSVLGDCTTVRPPILFCEFVIEVCFLLDGLPVLWYESSIYPCFVWSLSYSLVIAVLGYRTYTARVLESKFSFS